MSNDTSPAVGGDEPVNTKDGTEGRVESRQNVKALYERLVGAGKAKMVVGARRGSC